MTDATRVGDPGVATGVAVQHLATQFFIAVSGPE